jgi:fumarate hydratase, class II
VRAAAVVEEPVLRGVEALCEACSHEREPAHHPNDDVNRSQSSNDAFPAAMHLAAHAAIVGRVFPALELLAGATQEKSEAFKDVVKLGRTHLQDATPLTLGQEFSGLVTQLRHSRKHLQAALPHLAELALGGTAVGTGLKAPADYARAVAEVLSSLTGLSVQTAENKFEDGLVHAQATSRQPRCSGPSIQPRRQLRSRGREPPQN